MNHLHLPHCLAILLMALLPTIALAQFGDYDIRSPYEVIFEDLDACELKYTVSDLNGDGADDLVFATHHCSTDSTFFWRCLDIDGEYECEQIAQAYNLRPVQVITGNFDGGGSVDYAFSVSDDSDNQNASVLIFSDSLLQVSNASIEFKGLRNQENNGLITGGIWHQNNFEMPPGIHVADIVDFNVEREEDTQTQCSYVGHWVLESSGRFTFWKQPESLGNNTWPCYNDYPTLDAVQFNNVQTAATSNHITLFLDSAGTIRNSLGATVIDGQFNSLKAVDYTSIYWSSYHADYHCFLAMRSDGHLIGFNLNGTVETLSTDGSILDYQASKYYNGQAACVIQNEDSTLTSITNSALSFSTSGTASEALPTSTKFKLWHLGPRLAVGLTESESVVDWGDDRGSLSAAPASENPIVACGAGYRKAWFVDSSGQLTTWGSSASVLREIQHLTTPASALPGGLDSVTSPTANQEMPQLHISLLPSSPNSEGLFGRTRGSNLPDALVHGSPSMLAGKINIDNTISNHLLPTTSDIQLVRDIGGEPGMELFSRGVLWSGTDAVPIPHTQPWSEPRGFYFANEDGHIDLYDSEGGVYEAPLIRTQTWNPLLSNNGQPAGTSIQYAQSIEQQGFVISDRIYEPIPSTSDNVQKQYDCFIGKAHLNSNSLFTAINGQSLYKQDFQRAESNMTGKIVSNNPPYISWMEADTSFLLKDYRITDDDISNGFSALQQLTDSSSQYHTWSINNIELGPSESFIWSDYHGFHLGSDSQHHWIFSSKQTEQGEREGWILEWNRTTHTITGINLGFNFEFSAPCDFDNDGDLDVIFIQDNSIKWCKQLSPGTVGGPLIMPNAGNTSWLTAIRNSPFIAYHQDGGIYVKSLNQDPVFIATGSLRDAIFHDNKLYLYHVKNDVGHSIELDLQLALIDEQLIQSGTEAMYLSQDTALILFLRRGSFHSYMIQDSIVELATLDEQQKHIGQAYINDNYGLPLFYKNGGKLYQFEIGESNPTCNNPNACNYGAVYEECSYLCLFGCADTLACNFSGADDYDFDCDYGCVTGCTDSSACNFAGEAIVNAGCDYSCLPPIQGCKDPLAPNYNPVAEVDDNSCLPYPGGCFDLNVSETICHGNNLDTLIEYCLDEPSNSKLELIFSGELENIADAITVDVTGVGSFPSLFYSGSFSDTTITSAGVECISVHVMTDASASCQDGFFPPVQFSIECLGQFESGCIDSAACNYAPAALIDAGGCTYPNECGTCEMPLSGETGYIIDGTDPIRYETLIERDTTIALYKEWSLLTPVSYQFTDRVSIRISGNSIILSSGSSNSSSYSVNCEEASSFDALHFQYGTEVPGLSDFECGPDQGELYFDQNIYIGSTQTGYIIDRLRGEYHRISWEAADETADSIEIQLGESGRIIKVESPINEFPTGYSTASELEILPEYQWQSTSFVKVNYTPYNGDGNADVVIDDYLALWRDNQGGLYNLYWPEPLWSCAFPTEDYPDLDDSYFDLNSYDGYFQSCIGNQYLPGHSMFMFSPLDGKLWRFDFTQWTSGQNGGGFAYTRHHIGWRRSPKAELPVTVNLNYGQVDSIAAQLALKFDGGNTFEAPDYNGNGYVEGVTWGGCGTFETYAYYSDLRYYLDDTQSGYDQFQNSTCFNAYHSPSGQFYEFRFSEASDWEIEYNRTLLNGPGFSLTDYHRELWEDSILTGYTTTVDTVDFAYSGEIEIFYPPSTTTFMKIEAEGASGGFYGLATSGYFSEIPDVMKVLVGGEGEESTCPRWSSGTYQLWGGGGGSYVSDVNNNALIVAAGGSGIDWGRSTYSPNTSLATAPSSTPFAGTPYVRTSGQDALAVGGGGGGFYTPLGWESDSLYSYSGKSYESGGAGGIGSANGGFGGGGASGCWTIPHSGYSSFSAVGGGGGYQGGNASSNQASGATNLNEGWLQKSSYRQEHGPGSVRIILFAVEGTTCGPGCKDTVACNYDEYALEVDNTQCEYLTCSGCKDEGACNYSTTATIPDPQQCDFVTCAGCLDAGACNYDPDKIIDAPEQCDYLSCAGCLDPVACNYDEEAILDAFDCVYAPPHRDCEGDCDYDFDGDGVCDEEEVPGCTYPGADNFDPSATDENGTCQFAGVDDFYGCTYPTACNYNPDATADDASCVYPELGYDCDGNCLFDTDGDGICNEYEGCTNELACNYDPQAIDNDGSCTFALSGYDCDGNCLQDADGDGICDPFEFPGCTDPVACNYYEAATDDDGSCSYAATGYDCFGFCLGDMDSDGVCDANEIEGCAIENACNFDPTATDNDGSCVFAEPYEDCDGNCLNDFDADGICDEEEILGCTYLDAVNYNPAATEDDNTCVFEEEEPVPGCFYSTACNYQPDATVNDGSCIFPTLGYDCDGNCIVDTDGDGVCDLYEVSGCTDEGACNFDPAATDNDFNCDYVTCAGCMELAACDYDPTATLSAPCDYLSCAGCMDEAACNYDEAAVLPSFCDFPESGYDCDGVCLVDTDGDGECDALPGCTDPDALNYDQAATLEDGTCIYPCSACVPVFDMVPLDSTVTCPEELPASPLAFTAYNPCTDEPIMVLSFTLGTDDTPCGESITFRYLALNSSCANFTEYIQTISVDDNVAPEITALPQDWTLSCDEAFDPGEVLVAEDCRPLNATYVLDTLPGTCPDIASLMRLERTVTVDDGCGNAVSETYIINIIDTTAPVMANLPPATVQISCDQAVPSHPVTVAADCGAEAWITDTLLMVEEIDCPLVAHGYRTYTAMDACGNSSTFDVYYPIVDTLAPAVTSVPNDVTLNCGDLIPEDLLTLGEDCLESTAMFEDSILLGDCPTEYTIERTHTAMDLCGNGMSFVQSIDVIDTVAPSFAEMDLFLTTTCTEQQTEYAEAEDLCGEAIISFTTSLATDPGLPGQEIRLYTADDGCGNVSQALQVVSYEDLETCGGCMDPLAENHDEFASVEDGSCTYDLANPCPTDLSGDGQIGIEDLLEVLGNFGSYCE